MSNLEKKGSLNNHFIRLQLSTLLSSMGLTGLMVHVLNEFVIKSFQHDTFTWYRFLANKSNLNFNNTILNKIEDKYNSILEQV